MKHSIRSHTRFLAGVVLAILLAIPLGATAPPTLDGPLFDCAEAVVVRGYDAGATLRVYVGGVERGTLTGAGGYSSWVDLTAALGGGQTVQATQEVGGIESALSAAVFVAAPDPASQLRFELPLEACAQGGYVINDLAGDIFVDSTLGDQLATRAGNTGDFPTRYTRPLAAGESLIATMIHCRLGTQASTGYTVSQLYGRQASLPTPRIDAATAIECQEQVLVRDVIPGAVVRVFDGATLLGESIALANQTWVPLSSPMVPAWQLQARQELCKSTLSDPSPVVQPMPLSALAPPIVEGPIWAGQQHVWLQVPVSATVTLTVNGTPVRTVEASGRVRIQVESPFVAGQMVSAFYTVCREDSPAAPPVQVIAPTTSLPPPQVGFPLFACADRVSVSGLVDQAEVVILIDGQEVHHDFATGPTATFTIGPMLQEGWNVTAFQRIGTIQSAASHPVVVFRAPDLPKPIVRAPLHACQRSVVVENVLPGAVVTLFVDNAPFAQAFANGTSVEIPTLPLTQGWNVTAWQELGICQKSAASNPVPVGPPADGHLRIPPEIVEPVYGCQTVFQVRSLVPGTELDVFLDGLWKARLPVSSESMLVSIQPPLIVGQLLRVQPGTCGDPGPMFDETVVQKPKLDPPVLVAPIFHGDPNVEVTGAPPASLVRIYDASHNVIGAGMGGPGTVTIGLDSPAQAGVQLQATVSLCGGESDPSAPVAVLMSRKPIPHDAMVRWFWIGGGNVQALLQVAGRNVYKGSVIRIGNDVFTTFPVAQLVPAFPRDSATLGTPIDVIGSVGMLLFQDPNGQPFSAGDELDVSILNPDGSSAPLRLFNKAADDFVDHYDLAGSMNALDSDGDGLTDVQESSGATPDLTALGADPLRKNIFVEVDWMVEPGSHSHEPSAQSFDLIGEAFATAFVLNADGSRGIDLFVDIGQGGAGGDHLPHSETIAFNAADNPAVLYSQFYDNNFPDDRKGLFHYCVFGHRQPGTNSSGIANLVGDKLIVTLVTGAGELNNPVWISNVAGTFMHELGHNLNLHHGGDTPTNRKPNYPSVQNYLYQFPGISTDCDMIPDGRYDYSYGMYNVLNELDLDESRGICDGVPQDWNGTGGSAQTGVMFNINHDFVSDLAPNGIPAELFNEFVDAFTAISPFPLHDHCDWCFWTGLGLP